MMEAHQKEKAKEAIYPIFQQYQFSSQPKQFIRGLMLYLDLDQPKVYQKNIVADRIAHIYDNFRGQYEQFLNQSKFKTQNIPSDVNSFFWTVFKKYDQQRRNSMQYQPRHLYSRQPMGPPYMNLPNQNMNMSMVNMFLDVPNLQSLDQIQTFQKKMFQIYKNALPHVMNSMVYRPNPYHQTFGLNSFSNITPGVSGSNLGALNSMGGLGSMPGMQGVGNISGMPNMPNMGYQMKPPQYYDSNNNYGSRYMANFQHQSKTIPNEYRGNQSGMTNMGFNLFDRGNDDIRNYKTLGAYPEQRFYEQQQRKQGHKMFGFQQQMPSAFNIPLSSSLLQKDKYKNIEREPASLSSLQHISEPRKQVKRTVEEQNIIIREEITKENKQISCICQDKQTQQICYKCRLYNIDPFNQVQECLRIEHMDEEKNQIEIVINKKTLQRILVNPQKLDIQLRCIKADKDGENQISWPQKYRLIIDSDTVEDFTGASSNKKRKDKPVVFSKLFGDEKYSQQNVVINFEKKKSQKTQGSSYLFGAFVVNKLSVDKLYQKMMKKMQERNISEFFKSEKDDNSQIQSKEPLSVSPFYNSTLIKDPVRGKFCGHPECFDLKSFLASINISPNRQWKCPICSKQAKQVAVDQVVKSILLNIQKMIKQPKQIVFYPNGSHILRYEEENEIRKETVIISKKPSEEGEGEQNRQEK